MKLAASYIAEKIKRGALMIKVAQESSKGADRSQIQTGPFPQSFLVGLPAYKNVTLLNDLGINPKVLRKNIRQDITLWKKKMVPFFKEDYGKEIAEKYLTKGRPALRIEGFSKNAKKAVDEMVKEDPQLILLPGLGARVFLELLPKKYRSRVMTIPSETLGSAAYEEALRNISKTVSNHGIERAAILDDIILTGSTLKWVGSSLKAGGVRQVSCFAISVPGPIVKSLERMLKPTINRLFIVKEPHAAAAVLPVSKYIHYFGNKTLRELAERRRMTLGP